MNEQSTADDGIATAATAGHVSNPAPASPVAVGFHVTTYAALSLIVRHGLVPQIGKRSKAMGESVELVYLFPSQAAVHEGLAGWLGAVFEGDGDTLVVLEVDLTGIDTTVWPGTFELAVNGQISASRIRAIYDSELQPFVGPGGARQLASQLYDACPTAKPAWTDLGDVTQGVWIERAERMLRTPPHSAIPNQASIETADGLQERMRG